MAAAFILVLAVAAFVAMALPDFSGAALRSQADARAAHMLVAHQSAVDSVLSAGNPGPGPLPEGFVVYPDWFSGGSAFVSGTDGNATVVTWMDTEPRMWGEVAAAMGRRKPGKVAVGVIDRSGGAAAVVSSVEGKPVRVTGLGASVSGAPEGAPAVVTVN